MLAPSDKGRSMREVAAAFVVEEALRGLCGEEPRLPAAHEAMRAAAARGLVGLVAAEQSGCTFPSHADSVLVYEMLAQGCPSLAADLAIHTMVVRLVDRHGTPSQRRAWLPKLTSMTWVAGFCQGEAGPGGGIAGPRAQAVRDGDHYIVDAGARACQGAPWQDACVVMLTVGSATSAFLVEQRMAGVAIGTNQQNSGRAPVLALRGCRVPAENRIGMEGGGTGIAASALDIGRLHLAACALGGAQTVLKETLAWFRERKLDKRQPTETQAAEFRLAEMATELEAGRTFLWRTAAALDDGAGDAGALCAMAKRYLSDVSLRIAGAALLLQQDYGRADVRAIEAIVGDLRSRPALQGGGDRLRSRIAEALLGGTQ